MDLEKKINTYVEFLIARPFEDAYIAASKMLASSPSSRVTKMIVPNLILLPPARRSLVIEIIKRQTNCEVTSTKDNLGVIMKIKGVGETMMDIAPAISRGIKWLIK